MIRRDACVSWPCRRCDKAGRTSWRSREAWHKARRRRILTNALMFLAGNATFSAIWWWLS